MAHRLALTAALALCALGAHAEHEFAISREALRERVRVVALAPCTNRGEYDVPRAVVARYEARLLAGIEAANMRAVGPEETRRVRSELAEPLGAVFDSVTGEADDVKLRALREHTLRELQRLHSVDAVLDCASFDVRTYAEAPRGMRAPFIAAGEVLRAASGRELSPVQYVHALGVSVQLRDRADSLLYRAAEHVAWISLRNGDSWIERPPDEVFAPAYDARVSLLLEPLANATENAATPPEAR